MFSRFLDFNRQLSARAEERFGLASDKWIWQEFDERVSRRVRELPDGAAFIDLGGGRRCAYRSALHSHRQLRAVAIDIAPDELAVNPHLAMRVAADATRGFGIRPKGVDLLTSRTLLEHVDNVSAVVAELSTILKDGAVTIHLLPCRFSLFAIAARALPLSVALKIQHYLSPGSEGEVEFEVFYDAGTPSRIRERFCSWGFDCEVTPCYSQADYFTALFPAYLLVQGFDWLARRLGLTGLASYMIVEARLNSASILRTDALT